MCTCGPYGGIYRRTYLLLAAPKPESRSLRVARTALCAVPHGRSGFKRPSWARGDRSSNYCPVQPDAEAEAVLRPASAAPPPRVAARIARMEPRIKIYRQMPGRVS